MKTALFLSGAAGAALAMATAGNATPGSIGTLTQGYYACEMPGDAAGRAGVPAQQHDFTVVNASTYSKAGEQGTYLVRGDNVTMTSGPMRGAQFERVRGDYLRRTDAVGENGRMRCIRASGARG